jgi:hypothetical protein
MNRQTRWLEFALVIPAMLLMLGHPARAEPGACLPEARLQTAEQFLDQVRGAQERLAAQEGPVMERETTVTERSVSVRVGGKKGRSAQRTVIRKERYVALYRRITIAAYDECDGSLHTIALRVPHPLPANTVINARTRKRESDPYFVFTRLTPGYEVSHEGGMGVARLKFSVARSGRPLTVLAMKHPRVPSKYWRNRDPQLLDTVKAVVYSAYQPEYHGRAFTEGLIAAGVRRWLADAHAALGALRDNRVRSFAFPSELLADLWPPEVLLMLGTIEQSDDGAFRADPRRTAEAVAIEYAINAQPFYFANSSADAIGPYQFTDRWKGNRPGTYSMIASSCDGARLGQTFERAARELQNSMRAAVCLLDLELARMPADALRLFREDYQIGATYPVAAYNGGGGQSAKLYAELSPDALPGAAQSLELPVNAFKYRKIVMHKKKKRMIRTTAVIVNNETRSYLLKMFTTWDIVEDWMALAEPPGAGPGSAEPAVGNPADEAVPNGQMTGALAPAAGNTP